MGHGPPRANLSARPTGWGRDQPPTRGRTRLMTATPPRTDTRRVLIVEDHADSRDSLRVLLSIHGCEVRVAANALDGVRQAIDWRPDVVISDINLPGLDGWQL